MHTTTRGEVAAILMLLMWMGEAGPLAASLTVVRQYRLGEEDTVGGQPAVAGQVSTGSKDSSNGLYVPPVDLTASGNLVYSSDTPRASSKLSLRFDGTSTLLTAPLFQPHTTFPFTNIRNLGLELWVKPTAPRDQAPLFNGNEMGFRTVGTSGTSSDRWKANHSDDPAGAAPIRYNEWQHLAFVTTGSSNTFYVNGDPVEIYDKFQSNTWSGELTIGNAFDFLSPFEGLIDEVKIFTWGTNLNGHFGTYSPFSLDYFASDLLLGDMNGSGQVNNLDIFPFALALTDPVSFAAMFPAVDAAATGDINLDSTFNNLDIAPFAALLTGGAATVPEPSTCVLAALACAGLWVSRAGRRS